VGILSAVGTQRKDRQLLSLHRGSRVGTRFGPYELRSLIGGGGTGEVYRAYDTRQGRMVALKLLRTKLAADRGFQVRFRRDLRIAARLQEPHVLPVHDFGEIDGALYIEMPLVEGGSLKDLLRERGAQAPGHAAAITAQVAAALDAAHAAGLVHGDVQPGNVLLTPDNFVYLADFGAASATGSFAYAAPEQFIGGLEGPQTDVYSMACVLYECLTGEQPFEGAKRQELMNAHMYTPPPRPSIMRRGIDRAFDDVIAQGMAKQPAARFVSAGELARAAQGLTPSIQQPDPPRTRPFEAMYPNPDDTGQSPYPTPAPAPAAPAGNPLLGRVPVVLAGAGVVVLVAAAAIAAALLAFGNNHSGSPSETASAAPPPPPTTSATKTPSLSAPVRGADGLGFVGETARCDPGNPPAAVVRTAKSLAVVCQTGTGGFYYRGERISDGANIELNNAVPTSGGFDVTNPADGARYEVRRQLLRIISNGHVDSSEPVLQYASAV
jgi:serine/threonine-protein kinase